MAFVRKDIFYIPREFEHLPEAAIVREIEKEYAAAMDREARSAAASGQPVHLCSADFYRIQEALQAAQRAFDEAAGLPIPAPLTPKVREEVFRSFRTEQRDEVIALLEKNCGRTIPFERDADSLALEPYRLRALKESKGDIGELRRQIEAANLLGYEYLR